MVKVVEVSDSSRQKTLRGHEAPVLSVTFDPKDDYLVGDPSAPGVRCGFSFSSQQVNSLLDLLDKLGEFGHHEL